MNNVSIRIALISAGMRNYQLAEALGISEFTLSRKLRDELPQEEKERMLKIINDIVKGEQNANGEK